MDSPRPSKIESLAADPFASLPSQLTSSLIGSARTKAKWDVLPPGAHSITALPSRQPQRRGKQKLPDPYVVDPHDTSSTLYLAGPSAAAARGPPKPQRKRHPAATSPITSVTAQHYSPRLRPSTTAASAARGSPEPQREGLLGTGLRVGFLPPSPDLVPSGSVFLQPSRGSQTVDLALTHRPAAAAASARDATRSAMAESVRVGRSVAAAKEAYEAATRGPAAAASARNPTFSAQAAFGRPGRAAAVVEPAAPRGHSSRMSISHQGAHDQGQQSRSTGPFLPETVAVTAPAGFDPARSRHSASAASSRLAAGQYDEDYLNPLRPGEPYQLDPGLETRFARLQDQGIQPFGTVDPQDINDFEILPDQSQQEQDENTDEQSEKFKEITDIIEGEDSDLKGVNTSISRNIKNNIDYLKKFKKYLK